MEIVRQGSQFDVCVIGSGPAGGFMTKELTEAGAKVLLLEAGADVPPHEFAAHRWPYDFPLRGTHQERQGKFYPDKIGQHIAFTGDPISVDRIRVLGGRSTHWNAVCLRFSEDDFREGSIHGLEPDWPLTYQDIAPLYSYVERIIGLVGTRENLASLPDGEFYGPPPPMRCAETLVRKAGRTLGFPVIPVRKAMLHGQAARARAVGGRMPCHFCGHCMQGCEVGAIFTSQNTLLPLARATGNLTLRTNALVRRIETNSEGRATGVTFVDRTTRQDHTVSAGIVVVSCGAVESPRLLLNSATTRFANGIANSSELVGRYLTGHVIAQFHGYVKPLMGRRDTLNEDGATDHAFIPRFRPIKSDRGYVGGFDAQLQYASRDYPHHARHVPGYGAAFKKRVRDLEPALMQMGGYAKVLARRENRVTIDAARQDAHGIPIPKIEFTWCDNDRALWTDMRATLEEIYHVTGTELLIKSEQPAGFASHETGTCRMGADPKTSVLNPFCQSHDIPNLFVVDGSPFVTFPEKNPTLTIMALAVRAARYITEARRKGDL